MAITHITKQNFKEEVLQSQLPVLVDFWAPWCGPCRMLAPVIEQISDQYADRVLVGKVDTDSEQELAMRYGIMSIPTVIFFKDGEEIDRKVGVMPPQAYTAVLDANA